MNGDKNTYYGTDEIKSVSYLEFGSVNLENATKKIWAYWHDQEAYDLYMFARYARDLFIFRDFLAKAQKSFDDLINCIEQTAHDKIYDYIFKYAGIRAYLNACGGEKEKRICESGSSLFGLIEEMLAMDYVVNDGKCIDAFLHAKYLASDISEMMNKGAKLFHPHTDIDSSIAGTIAQLMIEKRNIGLFYGLSVSLRYAFRKAKDIERVVNNCDVTIFNRLSMSYDEDRNVLAGTGKEAYVLSIPKMKDVFEKSGDKVFYNTDSIQRNRDGENTVRASIIISQNEKIIEDFISIYNDIVKKAMNADVMNSYIGEWKEFIEL